MADVVKVVKPDTHRKFANIVIPHAGRDQGKVFRIEEMEAWDAERWAFRVLKLCARSGIDFPDYVFRHGMVGLVAIGLRGVLTGLAMSTDAEADVLMDELWACVKSHNAVNGDVTDPYQIKLAAEEPLTRAYLREEILSLHVGFSIRGWISNFLTFIGTQISTTSHEQNTPTSPT